MWSAPFGCSDPSHHATPSLHPPATLAVPQRGQAPTGLLLPRSFPKHPRMALLFQSQFIPPHPSPSRHVHGPRLLPADPQRCPCIAQGCPAPPLAPPCRVSLGTGWTGAAGMGKLVHQASDVYKDRELHCTEARLAARCHPHFPGTSAVGVEGASDALGLRQGLESQGRLAERPPLLL